MPNGQPKYSALGQSIFYKRKKVAEMKRKTGLLLSLILGASLLLAGCGSTQNFEPLENEINLADLAQGGTAAVSFTAEDIHTDGEETTIDLTVYNYELFDAVEVSKLAKGDTITADGNKIKVETVEENDGVFTINGGTENGGLYLRGGEGGTYYEVGLYNEKFFHEAGTITVPVSANVVITDASDLLDSVIPRYTLADLAALAADGIGFNPQNTTVTITNGEITEIYRSIMY